MTARVSKRTRLIRVSRRAHGTYARYQAPCRCGPCKAANRDYSRRWRDERRGSLPAGDSRHGTVSGYANYACRCDLCTAANYIAIGNYYLQRGRKLAAARLPLIAGGVR